MSAEKMMEHKWSFSGKGQNIIACSLHEGERQVLKPQEREQVLRLIVEAGEWDGPLLDFRTEATPDATLPTSSSQTPAVSPSRSDVFCYDSFAGQQIEITVQTFQEMVCPAANPRQAYYMLGWCASNRIDPFGNEAYFSIIDNKPVIQTSKDTWFVRMENHPQFDTEQSGLIVDTSIEVIKESILGGMDDYLIHPLLKDRLLKDFEEGKLKSPEGIPPRMTVKKKGIFCDSRETLIAGWCVIARKDRPEPYRFEPDVDGWKMKKGDGQDNIFWSRKSPFMIWKTAVKNCARKAFPELSGLLNRPEVRDEDSIDMEMAPGGHWDVDSRTQNNREVHRLGGMMPDPVGPLNHDDLHTLSGILYGVDSMSKLTDTDMQSLQATLNAAVEGDVEVLRCIGEDLGRLPLAQTQEETIDEQTESPDSATARTEPIDAEWSDDGLSDPA